MRTGALSIFIKTFCLCTLVLSAVPCSSQQTTTGPATTAGPCSPAVSGNNNQFTIKCQGISKQQADKILGVMNRILANELDTDAVMKKLDEIVSARNSVNQNCPNGICAGGNITGSPTVYNAAPQRKLSPQQKTELTRCLQQNPGKFTVASLQNNSEAYKYAQDWYDVFTAAHWSNEEPIPIAIFRIGGGMWSGMRISISGDWDEASQKATLKEGSPEKDAMACIWNVKGIGGVAIPYKDQPTSTIRIDVSDQPPDLPKVIP